ncbi:MAG TPA: MopE-related protein [Polyangiales bacterium]|nr:MopE-related protein [Polyangiales bacterium]
MGCGAPEKSARDEAAPPLRASGDCGTRAERCNARDDDCDGIIDERADSSCGLAHAAGRCVSGRCTIERCTESFFNCNDIASDGCETKNACEVASTDATDAPDAASMSMPDASTPPVQTSEAPRTETPPRPDGPTMPDPDEVDAGGEDTDTPVPDSDAGSACAVESCDKQDNDCDGKVDEADACSCMNAAPSGQGLECDSCLCDACPDALAACTGTDDEEWNTLCGALLVCFGKSVQAGLCTGSDSDCYQNGDGPCASEFRAAFERGWICTADPVRSPCGALTRVRLECFQNPCLAACKA